METTPADSKAVRPLLQSLLVVVLYLFSICVIGMGLFMLISAFIDRNSLGSDTGNTVVYAITYLIFGIPIFGIGRFIDKLNFSGKNQTTMPANQTEVTNQTPLQTDQPSQRAKMGGIIIIIISIVIAGYGLLMLYSGYTYLQTNPLATTSFSGGETAKQEFLSGVRNGMYRNGIILLVLSAAMIDFGFNLRRGKVRLSSQTQPIQPTATNPVKPSFTNTLLRAFLLINTFLLWALSLASIGRELLHLVTGQYVNYFAIGFMAFVFVLGGGTYYLYTLLKNHSSV